MDRFHRLADGACVEVRDLQKADRAALIEGFDHLSAESRYRRFLGAISHLSESQLHALLEVDGVHHQALAVVDVAAKGAERKGIAVAHSIREAALPEQAEFAIAVADEWQGRGVGRLLTRVLAEEAFRLGVRRWTATMLFSNVAVRRLLLGVGAETRFVVQGDGVVEATYVLDPRCFSGALVKYALPSDPTIP